MNFSILKGFKANTIYEIAIRDVNKMLQSKQLFFSWIGNISVDNHNPNCSFIPLALF